MKKILLCSSLKFRDQIDLAFSELKRAGFEPLFPDGKTLSPYLSEAERKAALAREHYTAMREADAVYFIIPDGYLGTSVTLELGYAAALEKPIFFSEKTGDAALDHYPKAFIPLEKILELSTVISPMK